MTETEGNKGSKKLLFKRGKSCIKKKSIQCLYISYMSYLMYSFLLQDRKPDIILDTEMSSSPIDEVTFLCFKCRMTYTTADIFLMHPCVENKQEAQALNPRIVLASQGSSEQKTEISNQNASKEVESYEDIPSQFDEVPDEIILKIFSFLSFKSLGNINQVSQRMKRIAEDASLWEKVEAWERLIPAGFIEQIFKSKVKYISFQDCEFCPIDLNILKDNNLDLKYMRISGCDEFPSHIELLSEMVKCSKSLEYLNIQDCQSDLVFKCIESIANPNNLKVLCLNLVELHFESVKKIIDECNNLTDFGISGRGLTSGIGLTKESIAYICTNLTPNVLKIDLSSNEVRDEHIQSLVQQCKNLEHLDICETLVMYKSVARIVTAYSHSLVSLALPHYIGMEIGLPTRISMEKPSNVYMEKLKIIFDLINLENLHIGCVLGCLYFFDDQGKLRNADIHTRTLADIFPKLKIGSGLASNRYRILNTDPYYHFYKQKFKEVTGFPQNFPAQKTNLTYQQTLKTLKYTKRYIN